jgi:hypothetical protein
MRYVEGDLVLRMQELPAPARLDELNREFADIVARGHIEPAEASKREIADNDVPDLARLRFRFDRFNYARLRMLIDALNVD